VIEAHPPEHTHDWREPEGIRGVYDCAGCSATADDTEVTHCPECDTVMPREVYAQCPSADCDYSVPEPEPYSVTYWQ
jgi:hypothetical protein